MRTLTNILSLRCDKENALTLYPWIHQFSNNKMSSDQTRPVSFPDVNPQSLPADSDFSMVAGDFQEVYSEPGEFLFILINMNIIIICTYIALTFKVLSSIQKCGIVFLLFLHWHCPQCSWLYWTIWNILKPGGVWINLGKSQILHNHFQSNVICKWKAENTHVVESFLYLFSKVHFFTTMRIWPMNCPLSWAMRK